MSGEAEKDCGRIKVNIEAELISSNVSYPAFVGNMSRNGIHARVAHEEPAIDLKTETIVYLKLRLPAGNTLNLNCRKRWSYKNTAASFIEYIGVEIISPPEEYREFYKAMTAASAPRVRESEGTYGLSGQKLSGCFLWMAPGDR
ncbi:MAG: PilZ domain-containing protein [Nitrospiraceae bacterium]|nr:MAG: PilZ domain-containing protein [Nitrospiraceae bacterium]